MTKKSPRPQTRHHILIYDDDWMLFNEIALANRSPAGNTPGLIIRALVRKNADEIRERLRSDMTPAEAAIDKYTLISHRRRKRTAERNRILDKLVRERAAANVS